MIWLTILSIFLITGLVHSAQRLLPFSVCPICAGVSLTWIGLLAAWLLGYPMDTQILAILMGGSVVGIAYQAGQILPITRSELLWKAVWIPLGFGFVFVILDAAWSQALGFFALLLISAAWFFLPWFTTTSRSREEHVHTLEQKMKNCC